jgi:hypothetical protein
VDGGELIVIVPAGIAIAVLTMLGYSYKKKKGSVRRD